MFAEKRVTVLECYFVYVYSAVDGLNSDVSAENEVKWGSTGIINLSSDGVFYCDGVTVSAPKGVVFRYPLLLVCTIVVKHLGRSLKDHMSAHVL